MRFRGFGAYVGFRVQVAELPIHEKQELEGVDAILISPEVSIGM